MPSPQDIVNRSATLFSMPDVYLRLKSLLDKGDFAMTDMAAVIGQDPALTVRLLHLVNSSYYNLPNKIETVTQAINLLGTKQIHDLTLATSIATAFSGMSDEVMNMEVFWHNSVRCAVASRLVSYQCGVLNSERLFISGLLHDIGHLLMYQHMPEAAQTALHQSMETGQALYQVERDLLGFDYAQLGSLLMQVWELPMGLQETTLYHVDPTSAEKFVLEASIVHIAKYVSTCIEANREPCTDELDEQIWPLCNLKADVLAKLSEDTQVKTLQALDLLFPKTRQSA